SITDAIAWHASSSQFDPGNCTTPNFMARSLSPRGHFSIRAALARSVAFQPIRSHLAHSFSEGIVSRERSKLIFVHRFEKFHQSVMDSEHVVVVPHLAVSNERVDPTSSQIFHDLPHFLRRSAKASFRFRPFDSIRQVLRRDREL
ncbi:MAG: hypothetical protein WB723_00740, partial [Candidatus Acidiferrales bacterium]